MKLVPFSPHPLSSNGSLEAKLQLAGAKLSLEWSWPKAWTLQGVGPEAKSPSVRAHELWKTTCFEAFLSAGTGEGYWEINLSPDGRWNVYSFDRYRDPQPPREASGWKLTQFKCEAGLLRATLELPKGSHLTLKKHGLTAVLETSSGDLSYWALSHAGAAPDFHDTRSWI